MTFTEQNRSQRQHIPVENLVPGRKNRIKLALQNENISALNFRKLAVSCGCMVVQSFESKLGRGDQSQLELDITSGTSSKVEHRELRFVEEDGDIWIVVLECSSIPIFQSSRPEFKVDGSPCSFELTYNEAAVSKGLVRPSGKPNDVSCNLGHAMIENVEIEPIANGLSVTLVPNPSKFGLQKSIVENLVLSSESFTTSLDVVFLNPKRVRVIPTTCKAEKLQGEGQRFLVTSDLGEAQLDWRGIDSHGNRVELEIVGQKRIGMGEIVEVRWKKGADLYQIEVYESKDPDLVFESLEVVHDNLIGAKK